MIKRILSRRVLMLTALLLTFALAVPASAATWRTFGQAKAHAKSATYSTPNPLLGGGARNVEDIQIGLWAARGMSVDVDGDWFCTDAGGDYATRSKSRTVWVGTKRWKWINLRSSSRRWDYCEFSAFAYGDRYRDMKLRIRVR